MGSACSNTSSTSAANSVHNQNEAGGATANGSAVQTTGETEGKGAAPLAQQDDDLIEEALADAEVANIHPQTEEDPPNQTQEEEKEEGGGGEEKAEVEDNLKEPEYELIYFEGLRLRCEPIRLILQYAGVPYKETLVNFEEWPEAKEGTPMGQLPVLKMGEETICQSRAIGRFLAHKYDLASEEEEEDAKMDMMMEGLSDLVDAIAPVLLIEDEFEKGDKWKELKEGKLKDFLEDYSQFLETNDTGYFVGNQVSWVDLAVSDFLAKLAEDFDSELLADSPLLVKHIEQIRAVPSIAEYVASRPKASI